MERYTSEQVRALLCEGCKHGLPVREGTGGARVHTLAGRTVGSCTAVAWVRAEHRESERLRMAAKRARRA